MEWLVTHLLAIGSALLSAMCVALGIELRQRAIQESADPERGNGWVRRPLWWAGVLGAVAGYVFQAFALSHGSLLLVQPLLVSSLLFVLPLNAAFARRRLRAADFRWALVLTAALAIFVLVGQPREGHYKPAVPAWSLVLGIAVPIVLGCLLAARKVRKQSRAVLLAVAVAVLLGMVAVLTKVSTHRFSVGGWNALLAVPAPYLLVVLAVTVTLVQQAAFRAGGLQASVPIMLVGEPVVAVLIGVVVLGEYVTVHGVGVVVLTIAAATMLVATTALARGSSPRFAAERPELDDVASSSGRALQRRA